MGPQGMMIFFHAGDLIDWLMRRPPLFQSCGLWFFEGTTAIGEAEIGGGMASTPVNVQVEESVLAGKRTERPVSEKVSPETKVSKTSSGVDVEPKKIGFWGCSNSQRNSRWDTCGTSQARCVRSAGLTFENAGENSRVGREVTGGYAATASAPSTPLAVAPEPKPKATPSPSTHSNPDLPEEEDEDEEGNEEDMIIMQPEPRPVGHTNFIKFKVSKQNESLWHLVSSLTYM